MLKYPIPFGSRGWCTTRTRSCLKSFSRALSNTRAGDELWYGGTFCVSGYGKTPKWPKPWPYVVTSTPFTERNSCWRPSVAIASV